MSVLEATREPESAELLAAREVGPLGRLGRWTTDHVRTVALAWVVAALALGAFAPRVEQELSGAGWEASGSESVQARRLIQENFGGLSSQAFMVVLHSETRTTTDPAFRQVLASVRARLRGSDAVASVVAPTISSDGRTAVVSAGSNGTPSEAVAAADELKRELTQLGTDDVSVSLTGASGMWSDFNEANKEAMLKSELISWPVTLAILVVAFGSLVAAGLPLMLTILGLVASAGLLWLLTHGFDISIWAMNFALMFALALGIDYALFIVHRFRGAYFGSGLPAREAVAVTMDTAGKAVLFSGLTVLISLSAVLLVPSPAFRSMALGIMLSVVFVLLAALTLLPAVLAKLGPKVDALSLRWVHTGEHRSPAFARWGERLWRRPHLYGAAATLVLALLALPLLGLKTGMPSIKVVPPTTRRASATSRSSRRSAPVPQERSSSSAQAPTSQARPRSRPATPASAEFYRRSREAAGSRSPRRFRPAIPPARPSARRSTASATCCRRPCRSAARSPRTTISRARSRPRRRS